MNAEAQKARVLLVGDELDSQTKTGEVLERESNRLTVETATDASEARNQLDSESYDCIVSQYELPDTDGIDLLTTVRQDHDTIPFILVTSEGSEEIAARAISAGVTDYVQNSSSTDLQETLPPRIYDVVSGFQPDQQTTEARQHLEELAVASNDIHWLFSADWSENLFINDAYESIWGRSIEALRANPRDFLRGVHPDDRDQVENGMEALSASESVDIEFRVNANENYQRWVWVQGEPIYDDTGSVVRVTGFARDITDRVKRRQQLRQAEARLRTLAENFPNGGVHYFDRDLRYQFVSGSGFQAIDTDPEDLEGNTIYEVDLYTDDVIETLESLMQATLDGSHETVELSYEDHVYKLHAVPLRDDGTVTGGFFISQDVTERRRRERELEARATAMDASIDGIAILDDSEEYVFVNQAHVDIYGHDDPDVFIGNSWRMCYDESELERFESEILPKLFDEGNWRGEVTGIRADGSTFPQEVSLSVTEDGRIICVVRDVSERKEREERMARQNERLEQFTRVVSHDLRNPLQVAEGRLELAQATCDTDHLDAVERAIDRMGALIDDLLTLARQGDSVTDRDPVDIREVAESSWTNVATADARLAIDADRTVPCDTSQLKRLFENLIRNAVEHGGEDVTVTVGELDSGFYIEDDGSGIPRSERAEVFEAGYSTRSDGTGFGLNIVKQIVDAHDWEISVTESRDGGARFEITEIWETDT